MYCGPRVNLQVFIWPSEQFEFEIPALQQKTIAFYCFIHVKLCYDFSLFSAIYQKNQLLVTNVAFN